MPAAFEVERILDVSARNDDLGFVLSERKLDVPYLKNYDSITGGSPLEWAKQFDMSRWGMIGAYSGGKRIGAAVIALNTGSLDMFEGREDLAVLWDIRVAPDARRHGVGSALFQAAEAWAAARGSRQLKIETQNINVPACKFYERQGCVLGAVNHLAYPELPDEVQLLWYKRLV